jgi:hypothetical protein
LPGGKINQVLRLLNNKLVNPTGKPIILYAPGYTQQAEKAFYDRLGSTLAPVYIARNQDELEIWLTEIQAAQGG